MSAGRIGCTTTPAQGSRIPQGALYACDNSKFGSDGKGRYWPGADHHLGLLADLTYQAPGPAHTRAIASAHQGLVDRLGESRTCLARAAKQLRAAADTRATPAVTAPSPPAASTTASRTR
ncbi:hypothetical protein ACIP79_02565 [Streptomyces sp. NPDC088747]|uniref:hypothetical protein n=1 Tax=Streptomyces sp. NPDC088747 TaxID=3365886 RepID=UPI00380652B2